jgi:hypothetical protein
MRTISSGSEPGIPDTAPEAITKSRTERYRAEAREVDDENKHESNAGSNGRGRPGVRCHGGDWQSRDLAENTPSAVSGVCVPGQNAQTLLRVRARCSPRDGATEAWGGHRRHSIANARLRTPVIPAMWRRRLIAEVTIRSLCYVCFRFWPRDVAFVIALGPLSQKMWRRFLCGSSSPATRERFRSCGGSQVLVWSMALAL